MKMTKRTGWIRSIDFLMVDILAQQLAFLLSGALFCEGRSPYQIKAYLILALVFLLLDIFVVFAFGTLDGTLKRGYYKEFAASLRHVLLVGGMVFAYLFEAQEKFLYSRAFIYSMLAFYLVFTYLGRIFWKKQLKQMDVWGLSGSLLVVSPRDRIKECVQNICKTDYNVYSSIRAVIMDEDCVEAPWKKSQWWPIIKTCWIISDGSGWTRF